MTTSSRGELISPEYQQLMREMHAAHPWGKYGHRYSEWFMQWFNQLSCTSLLDYGSGSETLRTALEETHPLVDVRCYDPGVPGREAMPEPAHFLVCTDVLEHVEEQCVSDVLNHMCSLMLKGGYIRIGLASAKRVLPDGRNAHITLKPREWWITQLKAHGFLVVQCAGGAKTCIAWVKRKA